MNKRKGYVSLCLLFCFLFILGAPSQAADDSGTFTVEAIDIVIGGQNAAYVPNGAFSANVIIKNNGVAQTPYIMLALCEGDGDYYMIRKTYKHTTTSFAMGETKTISFPVTGGKVGMFCKAFIFDSFISRAVKSKPALFPSGDETRLKSIMINGKALPNFKKDVYNYSYKPDAGEELPFNITYEKFFDNAQVKIIEPDGYPGAFKLVVSATGVASKTYTLNLEATTDGWSHVPYANYGFIDPAYTTVEEGLVSGNAIVDRITFAGISNNPAHTESVSIAVGGYSGDADFEAYPQALTIEEIDGENALKMVIPHKGFQVILPLPVLYFDDKYTAANTYQFTADVLVTPAEEVSDAEDIDISQNKIFGGNSMGAYLRCFQGAGASVESTSRSYFGPVTGNGWQKLSITLNASAIPAGTTWVKPQMYFSTSSAAAGIYIKNPAFHKWETADDEAKNIMYSTEAKTISINGTSIHEVAFGKHSYEFGVVDVNDLTLDALPHNPNAQVVNVVKPQSLPGNLTFDIVKEGAAKTSYTIRLVKDLSPVLKYIKINNNELPGFASRQFSYEYTPEFDMTYPYNITAESYDEGANITITEPNAYPGIFSINVESGGYTSKYDISFNSVPKGYKKIPFAFEDMNPALVTENSATSFTINGISNDPGRTSAVGLKISGGDFDLWPQSFSIIQDAGGTNMIRVSSPVKGTTVPQIYPAALYLDDVNYTASDQYQFRVKMYSEPCETTTNVANVNITGDNKKVFGDSTTMGVQLRYMDSNFSRIGSGYAGGYSCRPDANWQNVELTFNTTPIFPAGTKYIGAIFYLGSSVAVAEILIKEAAFYKFTDINGEIDQIYKEKAAEQGGQ